MAIKTFTTGEVLTAADTNTYLANSGLVYVAGGALSGVSTNFAGCFTSTYTNYRIVIDRLVFDTNFSLYWRALQGTTPVTGSNYQYAWAGLNVSGGTPTAAGTGQNKGYLGVDSVADSESYAWTSFDIFGPQTTARTTTLNSSLSYSSGFFFMDGMTLYNATGSGAIHDGIQFLGNGTSVSITGNVAIYGYRKA